MGKITLGGLLFDLILDPARIPPEFDKGLIFRHLDMNPRKNIAIRTVDKIPEK